MTVGEREDLLTDIQSDSLLVDLFIAASANESPKEAGLFLSALLTPKELGFLARRLRIAILLSLGYSYSTIASALNTGAQTISKVNYWLDNKEESYQAMIRKLGKTGQINKILGEVPRSNRRRNSSNTISKSQAKYSECFWPVEVIGAIIKGINEPDE